jgi:hypothetical protein
MLGGSVEFEPNTFCFIGFDGSKESFKLLLFHGGAFVHQDGSLFLPGNTTKMSQGEDVPILEGDLFPYRFQKASAWELL